jgi:hypothetical protein
MNKLIPSIRKHVSQHLTWLEVWRSWSSAALQELEVWRSWSSGGAGGTSDVPEP